MGYTRVIYTDATTAEAASVLKGSGFLESNKGGVFTSPATTAKVYVVWGRVSYYPEILGGLDFTPRIQMHFKNREDEPALTALAQTTARGLKGICPGTRLRIFDADSGAEIEC